MTTTNNNLAVLIVEDQAPLRAALCDLIGLSFPELWILEAADGATALALFAEHHPALVLMDVCLPDVNGIELTRQLKALVPETVVVVMSIQTGAHIVEQALAAGAAVFIGKDRIFTELVPFVEKHRDSPGAGR